MVRKPSNTINLIVSSLRRIGALAFLAALTVAPACAADAPLRIGYSDWPGWVAWQVAIEKGWVKDAGVDATFVWSDYSASIDAFAAGKLDADMVTNGDALVMGGGGAKSVMIMVTDYSNGNDVIIGKAGIQGLADLKGQKVGVEIGLVEHLLLVNGLEKVGLPEQDVTLVDAKTNDMPNVLSSGSVAAVGAWQPVAGGVMRNVPGAHVLYSSAQQPGLIYDVIAVAPASYSARKAEWTKLVGVWDRVVNFINDPATQPDALRIMAARTSVTPDVYGAFLKGTRLLTLAEGRRAMVDKPGFGSLYGSTRNANAFNLKFNVYKTPQDAKSFIDPSITNSLSK